MATQRSAGRWIAALLIAAVGGGVALFAWNATTPRSAIVPPMGGAVDEGDSSRSAETRDDGTAVAARRATVASESLLEPLDPAAMRALEQRGRARFLGVVSGRDGASCGDAELFFDGRLVARSDARGAYSIEVDHEVMAESGMGSVLAASHPEQGSVIVEVVGPSRRIDLALTAEAVLRGRVLLDGDFAPVAGAEVELRVPADGGRDPDGIAFSRTLRSDAEGRFEFVGLPRGDVEVRATATGGDSIRFQPWSLYDDEPIEVVLNPVATIQGQFAPWPPPDADPRAGRCEVRAWNRTSPHRRHHRRSWRADIAPDGTFALAVAVDLELQLALTNGDATWWADAGTIASGERCIDFGRIELGKRATIRGRVDAPLDALALIGPMEGTADCGAAQFDFERPLDGEGRFVIGPYPMTSASLRIFVPGRGFVVYHEVDVEPGGAFDAGLLAPRDPWWCGVVRDEMGAPVAFATIRFRAFQEEGGWRFESSCVSDAEGRYLIDRGIGAVAGPFELQVEARGFATRRIELTRPVKAAITRLDLALGGGESVRGVVRDESGAPSVGVRIALLRGDDDRDERVDLTGLDGRFEIRGVAAGAYDLFADAPDGAWWRVADVKSGAADVALVKPPPIPDEGVPYPGPTWMLPGDDR